MAILYSAYRLLIVISLTVYLALSVAAFPLKYRAEAPCNGVSAGACIAERARAVRAATVPEESATAVAPTPKESATTTAPVPEESATTTAPVPETTTVINEEGKLTFEFKFINDFADVPVPTLPSGPQSKNRIAIHKKKVAKAALTQLAKDKNKEVVVGHTTDLLNTASVLLRLSGKLLVTLTSGFHRSGSDSDSHATFSFSAPVCNGQCVGHAYKTVATISPGKGQRGKIFDSKGKVLFGGQDI